MAQAVDYVKKSPPKHPGGINSMKKRRMTIVIKALAKEARGIECAPIPFK